MSDLTLKRGCGKTFDGENWKLVGDGKWKFHPLYIPNGSEPFIGLRQIRGVEHAVFTCLDEDFFAQPVEVCKLPESSDMGEILSHPLPGEVVVEVVSEVSLPEPEPEDVRATSEELNEEPVVETIIAPWQSRSNPNPEVDSIQVPQKKSLPKPQPKQGI